MMGKLEILFIILLILLAFYFVIYWGSGGKKKSLKNPNIKNYLFGVRILISIIGIVALILWAFF